jgi:DNA mismatch repair protein MSH6
LQEIDCLLSLATVSSQRETPTDLLLPNMCRPTYIKDEESPDRSLLDIRDMIHPCVPHEKRRKFVANDTSLKTSFTDEHEEGDGLVLVTGPNMGGKSTILRQSCIAVILAQIGCFVPAKSMKMTLIDRIFTRLGAHDKLLEGKSTFFVEMEECKSIIEHATCRSLAIVDELGRGTSTFDGYALARAVL